MMKPFGTGWESSVCNAFVPRSVWTLYHRPKCNPEGIVYLTGGFWVDIYLASDDGAGGLHSACNTLSMTGTEGMSCHFQRKSHGFRQTTAELQ